MISKQGNPPTEVTSYRPISLLPIMAKESERLLLSRTRQAVPLNRLIPPYQFSFRENHSTAQQCHRIINKIRDSLEVKSVCFNFFYVQHAFDKVRHVGLLYKLKSQLSNQLYLVLKSYPEEGYFQVKIDDTLSDYHIIKLECHKGVSSGPYSTSFILLKR
jgi:hypothetical protein